jgi:hypothetical protein
MKSTNAMSTFAIAASPAGTHWIGTGVCGVALGSTALVWRSMR